MKSIEEIRPYFKYLLPALALLIVCLTRNNYDYISYGQQWSFLLEGGNPYDFVQHFRQAHPYGPLHNAFAFLYKVWDKIPRLIFALSPFLAYFLLRKRSDRDPVYERLLERALLFNPLTWIFFVYYSCNDSLVGLLFLIGLIAYSKARYSRAGLWISLSVGYKFLPLSLFHFYSSTAI